MILLVCFFWTLVLILGARILLYLHRSSRLNPHRLALFISSWFSIFPMIALVAIHPAIDVLLLGILVALIIFALGYPFTRLISNATFDTIFKSD